MAVPYKLNYFEIETGIDSTSTFIHTGDLTATKVKKYLATSNDILLGDGTTSSLSGKQNTITLTTTGTSGAATLIGATLNIPQYTDAFVGTVTSVSALTLGTTGTDLSSTVANSTTTPVITLNVPTSSATNRGALSAADWTTFNSKQDAGNYITSLTGEATASGPGAASVTLGNTAVIGKVLTGLNVTGGTVISTDTILAAFGKVQNQINGLLGGSIFQGTWDASTNTPALASSVGTNGYYYIVSVAGSTNLNGITDWKIGDWAIFAGTTWQKVDNTDSVASVNGYTGTVSLVTGDVLEGAGSLPSRPSQLYFTDARARAAISLTTTGSSGASTYDNGTGVLNIPTYTDAYLGTVTSVGLTMPSAFSVANSPITTSGTLEVTAIGSASQYIRGDGTLATIPSTSSGGANVNYYLNGSVAASVATYYQMSNSAVIGAGTDFALTGNGLISQFLTDLGNPNRLLIPGGAWNFEMYFNVSSSGGNSKFYVELLKYDGTTFTSIASSSAVPEEITGGTTVDLYITSLAVPETALLITDRLALRVYIVDNSGGRTVTLHTEDNTLCLVTTTFAGGIAALNGLTANTQYFAVGSTGTDFNISSVTDTHTFNIPSASASNRGLITTGTQTIAGDKTLTGALVGATGNFQSSATGFALQGSTSAVSSGGGVAGYANVSGGIGIFGQANTSGLGSSGYGVLGTTNGTGYGVFGQATAGGYGGFFMSSSGEGIYVQSLTGIIARFQSSTSLVNVLTINQSNATFGAGIIGTTANFTGQLTLGSTITNGTYTYTLPSATGTLALTSALSGYLPLTGGTLSTTNTTETLRIVNGGAGFALYVQTNSYFQGNVTFQSVGTSLLKTVSGLLTAAVAGTDYVIPSALSGYLPLSGGTLTGALNGTSATFSGGITSTLSSGNVFLNVSGGTGAMYAQLISSGNAGMLVGYEGSAAGNTWTGSTAYATLIGNGSGANKDLQLGTNGTVRQTITSGGNVLIGTTTDAGYKLDVNGTGRFSGALSGTSATFSGQVKIQTVANGTNAINFGTSATNYHTITYDDATGKLNFNTDGDTRPVTFSNSNVGIGTTSPTNKLSVADTNIADTTPDSGNLYVYTTGAPAANAGGKIMFGGTYTGTTRYGNAAISGRNESGTPGVVNGYLSFVTHNNSTGDAERMRITSGGFTKASNTGTYISSTGAYHEMRSNAADSALVVSNTSASGSGYYSELVTSGTSQWHLLGYAGGAYKVYIYSNGNIQNANNSYGAISDIKLKENITFATPKLADLLKVKIRNYNLIGEETKQIGVIAQELEEVFPSMIEETEDFEQVEVTDEEGNVTKERQSLGTTTKSVKYSIFVPMLIKAIQELKAEIDLLKNK